MRIGYHYDFTFRENKWKDQGLVSRTERTEKVMDIMKSWWTLYGVQKSQSCSVCIPNKQKDKLEP